MDKKYSQRVMKILENASTPELRQALERTFEYAERTNPEFIERLRQSSESGIDFRGVLAGPVRRTTVKGKFHIQRQREKAAREKASED